MITSREAPFAMSLTVLRTSLFNGPEARKNVIYVYGIAVIDELMVGINIFKISACTAITNRVVIVILLIKPFTKM